MSAHPAGCTVRFQLKPLPARRWYYEVYVFRTRPQMRAFIKGHDSGDPRQRWDTTGGLARAWERITVGPRGGTSSHACIGMVVLCAYHLGAGYVAHELTHAAIQVARRLSWDGRKIIGRVRDSGGFEPPINERFCRLVEHLNRAFWKAYYDRVPFVKVPKKKRGL